MCRASRGGGKSPSRSHDRRTCSSEVVTRMVTAASRPRHRYRHTKFLRFFHKVARAYLSGELHLIMENYVKLTNDPS